MRALSMVAASWCMGGAAGWQPGAPRTHRTRLGTRLRAAPADELFRLASDDARGTLDCARLSPNALAYVGDAVLELFWRGRSIWPPAKLADQQRRVVAAVRAEAQAAAVARLRRGPVGGFALSEADDAWLRRGRNAVGRRGPRRLAASVYADASGLECLAGALYVSDGDRCRTLLAALAAIDDASPT